MDGVNQRIGSGSAGILTVGSGDTVRWLRYPLEGRTGGVPTMHSRTSRRKHSDNA